MKRRPTIMRATIGRVALIALASLGPRTLFAHEEGVIRLGAPTAAPGDTLEILGEKLPRSATVRLELRGALETYLLGRVTTAASGAFEIHVPIPAEAQPGLYRVVAVAPDGDEVARAELVIAEVAATPPAEMPLGHAMATAEEMELPLDLTPVEWAVIGVFVALFALGGVLLLSERQKGTGRAS